MTPQSRDFHEILSFLESDQDASRKLLGLVGCVLECLQVARKDFRASNERSKNDENFEIFRDFSCRQCVLQRERVRERERGASGRDQAMF